MTVSVGSTDHPKDLAAAIYMALTEEFFDASGEPIEFKLVDKRDTQDDPFDRHVTNVLRARLPDDLFVIGNPKKLVNPDVVVARPNEYRKLREGGTELDGRAVLAIEVKKLERGSDGKVSRGSGGDYNSTPPSELIKVIAEDGHSELMIPAAYLFVLRDPSPTSGSYTLATLALVAGSALNRDVELYREITGIREKKIGLGTYADGADRQRPMLVFANPLGWPWLTGKSTLIARRDDLDNEQPIQRVRKMVRTVPTGEDEVFWCYRAEAFSGPSEPDARDPFPTPARRSTTTTQRGRFVISFAEPS